ncbi:MAG: carboxymuconolactone decarboxylase family protein [Rhodovibrionaceae bacterium]|nr:carboxymuconolactone decarboxylase family protein [Rhodovibrionaceae bacterium]
MARVSNVEVDEVPADVQPIYRRFVEDYGPFLDQVRVFAHRPPIVRHLMALLMELAEEGLVDKRDLEIAVTAVSKANACQYCVSQHGARLVSLGLDAETVERILEPDCPGLSARERLVRDYAVQVNADPKRVPGAMFENLKRHFSEAQIVELTFRATLCGFFNRFNEAMGIDLGEEALAAGLSGSRGRAAEGG